MSLEDRVKKLESAVKALDKQHLVDVGKRLDEIDRKIGNLARAPTATQVRELLRELNELRSVLDDQISRLQEVTGLHSRHFGRLAGVTIDENREDDS